MRVRTFVDEATMLHLQIRLVVAVYRYELLGGAELDDLRVRCLAILDEVRSRLNGHAAWHPELLQELASARAELSSAAPARAQPQAP